MVERRARTELPSSHGIDLAPMLDFVINLLMFFIITAVFAKDTGVAVARPMGGPSPQGLSNIIEIRADGTIRVDDHDVDIRLVCANVQRMVAANEHGNLAIVAHNRAPTGVLVAVVDEAHLGGIYDITFATVE